MNSIIKKLQKFLMRFFVCVRVYIKQIFTVGNNDMHVDNKVLKFYPSLKNYFFKLLQQNIDFFFILKNPVNLHSQDFYFNPPLRFIHS